MPEIMPQRHIPVKTSYAPIRVVNTARSLSVANMNRLKELRRKRGLSQVQLSEIVGCNQATISKIEKGQANPTLDLIEALAVALHTSPVSLFGLSETQQRAIDALERMPADARASALFVLEKMAEQ